MRDDRAKPVADIEGPWVDPSFESGLTDRCRRGWNMPVSQLPDELLATYLRQRIALSLVLPEARRRLAQGCADGSELYEGELQAAMQPFELEVISSRSFSAARETLFAAVRDPAIFARWWGPAGFRNRFDVFEFRPGGAWRFTMTAPDGTEYPTVSRFDEIVPPERIVLSHLEPGHHFRMTMTFDELNAGTRLTWRMEFDSAAEVERVGKVVADCNEQNFDRLAAEIARLGGTT